MKILKKIVRFFRVLFFAFMFAVCMVMGIVPIVPKRKEECEIEIKIADTEKEEKAEEKIAFYKGG
jgi:hypothetical protein